jgi:hypothetical protein
LDVDISASGVRIGTDLFVGFPSERVQLRLRKVFVFNMKLHSKTKPAKVAWANADIRSNASVGGVLLVLLGDVIESTPEAGGVSGVVVFGFPGPPIAFGTERSAPTDPSLASVWPLRPPIAVAVAVKSGLIVSMALIPVLAYLRLMQAQRQRADNGTFYGARMRTFLPFRPCTDVKLLIVARFQFSRKTCLAKKGT